MHADGESLYATRVSLRLPDGTIVPNASGGIGNIDYEQDFPSPPAASVASFVRTAAMRAGLDIVSVDVLQPEQPAPELRVKTRDPAGFVANATPIAYRIFGNPPNYEGYYLRVDDEAGAPVFIQATDFRIGAGHEWIRPDIDPDLRTQRSPGRLVPSP